MSELINSMHNNALAAFSHKAAPVVMSAIKSASAKTGVNFAYMVQQARAESSFDPSAKAKTSSASGLYQFIERTWLDMVERYGDKHGISTDGKSREQILEMRNNPKTASLMAAEFAGENQRFLETHWKGAKSGKDIGSTELYFAHFMGAGGAAAFLNARDENPGQQAALIFPKAAAANRNVFYDTKTGRPKTMDEIYNFFDKKFEIKGTDMPQMAIAQAASSKTLTQFSIRPISSIFVQNQILTTQQRNISSTFGPSYNSSFSSYQNMLNNPVELMLLTQLDVSFDDVNNLEKKRVF